MKKKNTTIKMLLIILYINILCRLLVMYWSKVQITGFYFDFFIRSVIFRKHNELGNGNVNIIETNEMN